MMINFDKYPIINNDHWALYVEDPEVYPPRVRNVLKKFNDNILQYEITDPKVQYLWSIKEHYSLPPLDALKHELGNIIIINKMVCDNDQFYCEAKDKFRVEKFNPGTFEERIVVVFGTYEKQVELRNAGIILFAVTLGASSTLPALSVKAFCMFYSKIAYDAQKTNAVDFNPQNVVKEGAIKSVSVLMGDGFCQSMWNLNPLEMTNSLWGRLTILASSLLVSERTNKLLSG